jgi:hypothetical protein
MNEDPLCRLIAVYGRGHGPRLDAYLDYFRNLKLMHDAIRFAYLGKEGTIHRHQYRVGEVKLEQARSALQTCADRIEGCSSFDELLRLVEECTSGIDRFGVLAVYDTSLRLGAYRGLWPEVVYLHAGTKKGCRALAVRTTNGMVEMKMLPQPLQVLEPFHAENFLCVFKDRFTGEGREDAPAGKEQK